MVYRILKLIEDILAHLDRSIQDEIFSKSERRDLKTIIGGRILTEDQLNFLRSKAYDLASSRATDNNYKFVLEWLKNVINTLIPQPEPVTSSAFFSPGNACREVIINHLNKATAKINICVFTISDDQIANAIIGAHHKGVNVQVITDNDKSLDTGSDILRMAKEKILIKMDDTPNHMHHKFMIVDERVLITGSYNWTHSAARYNHENVLLTHEQGVIKSFLKEFSKLWGIMNPVKL